MIPQEHKFNIIHSGINFLRTITQAYGSEEGMKLWDTIANTLDPDIKGQIFLAMLTGEYRAIIPIHSCQNYADKIDMIKAIRKVDGSGLKEAKDIVEHLMAGNTIEIRCDPKRHDYAIELLRDAGFNV